MNSKFNKSDKQKYVTKKQVWEIFPLPSFSQENIKLTIFFQILIHIGVLANEDKMHFAEEATKGGPLGELVQWSDIITSLFILGHDITVTADLPAVQR